MLQKEKRYYCYLNYNVGETQMIKNGDTIP